MSLSQQSPMPIPEPPAGLQILPSGAIHFSLNDIPQREHFDVFREVFGRKVLKYDLQPLPDVPFDADLTLQMMPRLAILSGRVHGSRSQRSHATTDDITLIVGPQRIAQGGCEVELDVGDASLVRMGDVFACTHEPPGDLLALRVPLKEIAPLVPGIEDQCVRRIPRDTSALRLLTRYARLAQDDQGAMSSELQQLVIQHLYDLMALAVGANGDAAERAENRGLRAARLHAIKQDIVTNIDQPDLSVMTLAARHRLTPRYIQRLFEAEETTLTDYVLSQRLALAHRMLTDRRRARDKISAVAYDCGFGDVSYFNRVFRRVYGVAPSDVRRAGAAGRAREAPRRT